MGCESNCSKCICVRSCKLGKSWSCCPPLCVLACPLRQSSVCLSSRRHFYIEGEGGRLFSSPMPVHHRGCISECDHHPYGGYDPTIAVCVVYAECTYCEDQHETGHQRWLLCPGRIFPGHGGCFSGGMR